MKLEKRHCRAATATALAIGKGRRSELWGEGGERRGAERKSKASLVEGGKDADWERRDFQVQSCRASCTLSTPAPVTVPLALSPVLHSSHFPCVEFPFLATHKAQGLPSFL